MSSKPIRLGARFLLDEAGRPKYIQGAGKRHYKIELFTMPEEIPLKSVTYVLDPSYYDPKREVDNPEHGFREEITSYGDYNVTVHAQTPSGVLVEKEPLSTLLERSYSSSDNTHVAAALEELRRN